MAQYAINLSDSGGSSLQKEISLTGKALAGLEKQTQGLASAISDLFSSFSLDKVMTQAEKTVKRTTTTVRKQTQKALLSFDEIERIGTKSASTTSTTSVTTTTEDATNVNALAAAFWALQAAILGALGAVSSETVVGELNAIRTAAQGILTLYQAEVESDIPTWLQGLALSTSMLTDSWKETISFLGNIPGVFSGLGTGILTALKSGIPGAIAGVGVFIAGLYDAIVNGLDWLSGVLIPAGATLAGAGIGAITDVLRSGLEGFLANVKNIFLAVKSIFTGVVDFVKNVFSGNWRGAWQSVVNIFKGIWDGILAVVKAPVNAVIGLINGLIGGVISGINGMISALNKISFTIPSWVPALGGQYFGFHLSTIAAPKIPYLAQGAVLPANRPFLAVVGDQKHGTNVEAPLDVIKQALAEVLGSQGNDVININFTGDLSQLARVLQPEITRESSRAGRSFMKGVVF